MGATHGRWLGRAVSRIPLLLLIALLAVVVGAVPGDRAGAAAKNPPGDPPGNNGTVKIERDGPADEDKGNEPIGDGCMIWLEYYGFDQGQTADITFTAQAPSGNGEVLIADKGVPISNDAAGGGQDDDAVIAYNLTSAVQNLKHQKNQGYHIKLSSDTREAPGGAKHKVFWIDCAPAAPTTLRVSKAMQGTGAGPFAFKLECNHRALDQTFEIAKAGEKFDIKEVPPGTVCVVTETDNKGAQSTAISENPPHGKADDGQVKLSSGNPTTVTFTNVFPGTEVTPAPDDSDIRTPTEPGNPGQPAGDTGTAVSGSDATVLGETLTRPDPAATLPRTGGDPTPLAVAGLWSLAAGGLALLAGRRLR